MNMTITEKIANLKGFLEGVQLAESNEKKILDKIIDILEDMALEIEDMEESIDTLGEYAEELDEDLGDVEEYLFGEDECDCDDDDCDCCDCCDDGFFEIECPECGEIICVDEDFEGDVIECPACNKQFKIEDEDAE